MTRQPPDTERYYDDSKIPTWIDRDEMKQVADLARLEAVATGFDPDIAAPRAVEDFVRSEIRRSGKEQFASVLFRRSDAKLRVASWNLGWVAEAQRVVGCQAAREQTPGQRRRFLRDQLILVGRIAGFPQRSLAVVFGLPHSRIAAIEKVMREKTGRG